MKIKTSKIWILQQYNQKYFNIMTMPCASKDMQQWEFTFTTDKCVNGKKRVLTCIMKLNIFKLFYPEIHSQRFYTKNLGKLLITRHIGMFRAVLFIISKCSVQFSLLSHVQLFVIPWTAACQASLSIINYWSLLKFMCIESVMPSNYLILFCPLLLLPSIFPGRVFSNKQFFTSGGQSTGVSALTSVLPMSIQG